MTTVPDHFHGVREDTAANWTSHNPILKLGQIGRETDTIGVKVGDGTTAWNSLAYTVAPGLSGAILKAVAWAALTLVPARTLVRLPTGGLGYQAADYTTRASFDATERATWTFIPGGHRETVTSSGTWVKPTGITTVRTRGKAGGAGAPSGGTATTGGGLSGQVGGSGGGPGGLFDETWQPTGNLTWVIGAKGTGGASALANNHAGNPGTAGGTTSVTDGTTTYSAPGGSPGGTPAGNSTAQVFGGIQGGAPGGGALVSYVPGIAGVAASTGGGSAMPNGEMCGGGGGNSATATLGGAGGAVAACPGQSAAAVGTQTGTSAGGAGASAIAPGHGGAGGGAGAPGGASGAGGNGADGIGEVSF